MKNLKYHTEKVLVISIICSKCKNENKKISKEEESTKMLKVLDLIENSYFKSRI